MGIVASDARDPVFAVQRQPFRRSFRNYVQNVILDIVGMARNAQLVDLVRLEGFPPEVAVPTTVMAPKSFIGDDKRTYDQTSDCRYT